MDDSEFAEAVRRATRRLWTRAVGIGGADTGAGPTHWYENYNAKNSRPWMVVDPPDGRIPPMTAEGQKPGRWTARAREQARPERSRMRIAVSTTRCITRGIPGSMMPAIYGNSYQIVQAPGFVAIRYEMIHETRIIPLDGRRI